MTTISTVRAFAGTTPYMVSLTDDLDNEWLADEPLAKTTKTRTRSQFTSPDTF